MALHSSGSLQHYAGTGVAHRGSVRRSYPCATDSISGQFTLGEDSLSNCEYGRCGTKGHREREQPSWQAQLVLRIWAKKSPQTSKDWRVCKHCCDLMIHDLQVEEMGYEKHLLPKAESQ